MKRVGSALALVALSLSAGCAAILTGVDQKVAIETRMNGTPLAGATCRLTNSKGTWFVTTPGEVVVRRAGDPVEVDCTIDNGDASSASLAPTSNNAALANILLGGVVGIAIDAGSGAAYHYPERLVVDLHPRAPGADDATTLAPTAPLPPSIMATLKYQIAAENFARSLACAARPIAVPTSFAADGETYAIRCTSGATMTARCAEGMCRVLR